MFSECLAFPIKEGCATLIGSACGADIRLEGREIFPRHAVIELLPRHQGKGIVQPDGRNDDEQGRLEGWLVTPLPFHYLPSPPPSPSNLLPSLFLFAILPCIALRITEAL